MSSVTLQEAIRLVKQLSAADRQALLHEIEENFPTDDSTWALEGAQLAFMLGHHDAIEAAYASGDLSLLDALEASQEYRATFGEMSWDEAYDRYEETWWKDDDASAA